jgi:hypothetical protein
MQPNTIADEALRGAKSLQVNGRPPRDLFPLPLTPFELFMLFADQPELPMAFCGEMIFRGRIDRGAFQRALDETVARHPLLAARLEWSAKGPQWISGDVTSQSVEWLTESNRAKGDDVRSFDLTQETGLRVLALEGNERSTVWLHFHHACCDGQGARPFIADLWTGYAKHCSPEQSVLTWDNWDYESLRRRFQLDALLPSGEGVKTTLWQKLRDAYHFLVLTPRPVSPGTAVPREPPSSSILKHSFDEQQTTMLRQHARRCEATLNDIAIALLFETLAEWNQTHGRAKETQRIQILMPTDLRSVKDSRMPAANRMSFSFIPRTIGQCRDGDSLLRGLRSETQYIKQVQLGRDFLGGLALANTVPGLLRLLVRLPRCMATALLSNLGDPTKRFRRYFPSQDGFLIMGNLVLEKIFATPPIRPLTHAGFGLCICSNGLCVSMLGNKQVLGSQATDLFHNYVQRWQHWVDLPPSR